MLPPSGVVEKVSDEIVGRILPDLTRGAGLGDAAVIDNTYPVCKILGFVDIVSHENYRSTEVVMEVKREVLQLDAGNRVKRAERLIHQYYLRAGNQCPQYADPLLFAA